MSSAKERQSGVLRRISANLGKKRKNAGSVKQAAIEMGYSESYAKSGQLQKTKMFQKLLAEYISDDELAKEHKVLLYDREIEDYIFPKSYSDELIKTIIESFGFPVMRVQLQGNWKRAYFPIINAKAKKDALDMAYKIKHLYTNGNTVINEYSGYSREELERLAAGILGGVRKDREGTHKEG